MNRNTETHFSSLPAAKIGRSKFDRSFTNKTSFNSADLVPVYVDMDIVPGDTVTMRQSEIIRMATPIAPVMDNCFLDFYWFFTPDRLLWDDFKKFMGENETAPWTQQGNYEIPQIKISTEGNGAKCSFTNLTGSIYEKMGIPPQDDWTPAASGTDGYKEIKISALPARAYCLIYNEFFRDENLQNPLYIPKNSGTNLMVNKNISSYQTDPDAATIQYEVYGGLPPIKVCKPHDYFTSALPGAQKGPAVNIPLSKDRLPVQFGYVHNYITDEFDHWMTGAGDAYDMTDSNMVMGTSYTLNYLNGEDQGTPALTQGSYDYGQIFVDLTKATGATITQLRQAFAIQKFYERDSRGGTRYIESVWSHFGVRNPDYRLQRPEYLGGFRHHINMNQVVQNTPVVEDTPLGTTGAYSVTSNKNDHVFSKSFTEHGILLGLCCIRTCHTYQQGINRSWFKKKRLDFYSPEFANLSEQAILNQEIYAQGTDEDREAFGYQEAWAEMRYMPDMVTGELRSQYAQSLDIWHYGDYYSEKPVLGNKWIQETPNNIERTLAVQDHDQFIADFYFGAIYTRPMPLYSIPGLIDHH